MYFFFLFVFMENNLMWSLYPVSVLNDQEPKPAGTKTCWIWFHSGQVLSFFNTLCYFLFNVNVSLAYLWFARWGSVVSTSYDALVNTGSWLNTAVWCGVAIEDWTSRTTRVCVNTRRSSSSWSENVLFSDADRTFVDALWCDSLVGCCDRGSHSDMRHSW